MGASLTTALWLLVAALALFLVQRLVQQTVQQVLCLLTGRVEWALFLYALLLLPGVILHEGSHWLTAKLLRMRTGRVSLWPKLQRDRTLRLGYVETERVDFLRSSLVGAAPLVAGILVLLVLGQRMLRIDALGLTLVSGDYRALPVQAAQSLSVPFAALWVYLIFAVSNSMFPSPSDRRSWPWVGLVLGLLVALALATGAGEWLVNAAGAPALRVARTVATTFSMTVVVDAALLLGLVILRFVFGRLRGR